MQPWCWTCTTGGSPRTAWPTWPIRRRPCPSSPNARGLRWRKAPTARPPSPAMPTWAWPARWSAGGERQARLQRGQERATVDLTGLYPATACIDALSATMPQGRLGAGEITWTPWLVGPRRRRWPASTLAASRPTGPAPSMAWCWPPARSATTAACSPTSRRRVSAGPCASARCPGAARCTSTAMPIRGDVALRLGDNRIEARGRIAQAIEVDRHVRAAAAGRPAPPMAAACCGTPGAARRAQHPDPRRRPGGRWHRSATTAPTTLVARGALPWARGAGNLVDARGLEAGSPLTGLQATLRGAVGNCSGPNAQSEYGTVALRGVMRPRNARAGPTLATLARSRCDGQPLDPAGTGALGLGWPATAACRKPACARRTAATCAPMPTGAARADLRGSGPLALLVPYLPERGDGRPWVFSAAAPIWSPGWQAVGASWRHRHPDPPGPRRVRNACAHAAT